MRTFSRVTQFMRPRWSSGPKSPGPQTFAEHLHVAPCTKRPSAACKDEHPDVGMRLDHPSERRGKLGHECRGPGVEFAGAVEGDNGNRPLYIQDYGFVLFIVHALSP